MKRVLVIDDHELVALGVVSAISALDPQTDMARTFKHAKRLLTENTYDVIFLDINLEDDRGDGRDLKIWMNQTGAAGQTIAMSSAFTPAQIQALEKLRFDGFYSKSDKREELIAAVESLAYDGVFHSSTVLNLIDTLKTAPSLTKRQTELMHLVANGASNKEAAHEMNIRDATIAFHMTQLKERLGVRNAREIGARARELGLLE